ncbi:MULTISPECIES: IPExxxVDY family protein [Myroides]|uniref:IPExxxVDY family protein n=1 Tax=Myroides TaxID=76831 RepID=UPI0013030B6B|nr:IPExxxVDY family protein [Myroides phaeus]
MGMVKYRLDDLIDYDDYKLIAIHSSRKEDYKVVYFINSVLEIFLERSKNDVDIHTEDGRATFSFFEYDDIDHHVYWKLVSNKAFLTPESGVDSPLFTSVHHPITKQGYLVPELKVVDYLIKIEEADYQFDIGTIIEKLNSIKIISTAYEIKQETLKNKNNLIF